MSDKILLYGDAGAGKSSSIATILKNCPDNRRIIYLMSEKNAKLGFEWGLKNYNIQVKPGQVYYASIEETGGFTNLSRSIKSFTSQLQSVKHSPNDRTKNADEYGFLHKVIGTLEQFLGIDYVTGETVKFGDVGKLTVNDVLVIDGLSPIASECWKMLYGDVLLYSAYDYGPAQQLMYQIFHNLQKINCNVVLLAHEKDYTSGTPGKSLEQVLNYVGPDTKVGEANFKSLMGCMTEVIHATRIGSKYIWEGNKAKVYTVVRKLPARINLDPDFSKYNFFEN